MTLICKAIHLKHARKMFGLQFICFKNWGLPILVFLGFIVSSLDMTISLTPEKIEKILHMVRHILDVEYITIRVVASFIGLLVSFFPGVQFAQLYYWNLEICKNMELYHAKGDFDATIFLTVEAFSELSWWVDNVQAVSRPIKTPGIDLTVYFRWQVV